MLKQVKKAKRAKAANDNGPLAGYEGAMPPAEIVAKLSPEPVSIDDKFDKIRGRALQVSWRPRTMFARGAITKRHLAAAMEIVTLYEAGHVAPIKAASWGDRVEGGGAGSRAPMDGMIDAARRYRRAMDRLCQVQRVIVYAVCVEGMTLDALTGDKRVRVSWLPGNERNLAMALSALFAAGLETIADALGI